MTKIDFVFVLLGFFCYFSILMRMKDDDAKLAHYNELQKKKQMYANQILERKKLETLAKVAEERKQKRKDSFMNMANTVEKLATLSDQEVMRKSHITNGL